MSVLIKGMEMPTCCCVCPCFNDEYCYCQAADKDLGSVLIDRRHPDCPLIEVPLHGRLIDADELIEDLERQCKEVFRIDAVSPDDYWITRNEAYTEALLKTWVESFGNYLKTRQTVIPADKDGET